MLLIPILRVGLRVSLLLVAMTLLSPILMEDGNSPGNTDIWGTDYKKTHYRRLGVVADIRSLFLGVAFGNAEHAGRPPFYVFGKKLAEGWEKESRDCKCLIAAVKSPHPGNNSISVTYTKKGGSLAFASRHGIYTYGYEKITFYVDGGENGGQKVQIVVEDNLEGKVTGQVALNDPGYITGGTISANRWKLVSVPLADLNAEKTTIFKITIMDDNGSALSTFYISEVVLTH